MDDVQKTINEVVDGVKSEGLFDQFRKECVEEFEIMETYHQLKQRVENHVTSFLSKHKFHDGLQKNTLRSNLRNYISKSDILLNGITQLVDEVLSLKGKSFCLRIDKHVDKHLSKKLPILSPLPTNGCGKSEKLVLQNGLSVVESNSFDEHKNDILVDKDASEVVLEEHNGMISNETITEFTEMEIEEVEMDLSENQEFRLLSEDEEINGEHSSDTAALENLEHTEALNDETELDVKVKTEVAEVEMDVSMERNTYNLSSLSCDLRNQSNEIKNEPENIYKPVVEENEKIEKKEVKKEVIIEGGTAALEDREYKGSDFVDDNDISCSLILPPIITEPITDDSNSNDSTFADSINTKMDEFTTSQKATQGKKEDKDCRRKSSRVRTLPLKFREIDDIRKRTDDADSVSSNDIDYKDLEDGAYLMGKRGRPRKRPLSAGNPEMTTNRIDRRSSAPRSNLESGQRRKRSPSISKQEEEAINFLTKPEVRKSLSREGRNSKDDNERVSRLTTERVPSSRESRDEIASDEDGGRCSRRLKSESEKDERNSEREQKFKAREGSSSGKEEEVKPCRDRNACGISDNTSNKVGSVRNSHSRKDHKFETSEGGYSSIDDDDKNNRNKREKNLTSRDVASSSKDNEDRKSRDRRDKKSSDSSKDDDRSSRNKRDKTDFGESISEKNDPDRKSRMKREEKSEARDEKDSLRNAYRKRIHSPTLSSGEGQSKRSRRSIKQRQRYTPP